MEQRKKGTIYRLDKEFIRNNKKRELIKIATFLLTDGGLSKDKNTYVIYFTNKSEALHEEFKNLVKDIIPEILFRTSTYKETIRTYLNSKELADLLFEFSNSYRTSPCESYPPCALLRGKPEMIPCVKCQQIDNQYPDATYPEIKDTELLKEVLRIIADTEGGPVLFTHKYPNYLSIKRRIDITCTHPILKKQIKEMVDTLSIPNTIDRDAIRISGKGIPLFRDQVGFGKNVKMSRGKFRGFNKNSLLEIMILINEMTVQKKFFPNRMSNVDEVLRESVEIFDKTHSREQVIEYLLHRG